MHANSNCTAATKKATMHSRMRMLTAQSQHRLERFARKQYASLKVMSRMDGATQSHHAKPLASSLVTSVPRCRGSSYFRHSADAVSM